MTIQNHIIEGVNFKQTPNISGLPIVGPKFLIIHYTTSGDTAGTVAWLTNSNSRASAHIVIGRDGEVWQLASFDQCAWHCGESEWLGIRMLNRYSIGIELVNWGPVILDKDGKFRSHWGQEVPADQVEEATHKNGAEPRYWHRYTNAQVEKAIEVARAILEAYPSIEQVLGHDDIAPTRKVDPGPLFPWERFLVGTGRLEIESVPMSYETAKISFDRVPDGIDVTILGDVIDDTERMTTDEARALRDWLNKILKDA